VKLAASTVGAAALALCVSALAQEHAASSNFADLDGMKVHYTNRGEGDAALVFVHGWNCDLTFWKKQVDAFPKTRVIAIDLPGHGESDKPQIAYTMDLHARAIDAALRDAHVEKAVLVGHSNGTPVIRQFYRMFPQKTRGLVIVDGALRPFAPREQMEKFIAPMRAPDYREYIGKFVDAMTKPMKDAAARSEIKSAMLQTPQHVSVSEMESILPDELWRPDKINVPTLVILAKQPAWNAEYEAFVRGLVPNVDYRVWDGVSHFLMIDRPQEFNATVAEFVAKNHLLAR
jgi:pimeloyl-ACP methyl ester carboxylesterase